MGELDRQVGAQFLRGQAIEDLTVRSRDGRGRCSITHAFAEQRRIGLKPRGVQPAEDLDAVVQRLPGHKPISRESSVPAHPPTEARTPGGGQQRLAHRTVERQGHSQGCRVASAAGHADADFVEVAEQVGRVLIDTVGAGAFQLVESVPPRLEADTQRPRAARSEQIPDTVADDHG